MTSKLVKGLLCSPSFMMVRAVPVKMDSSIVAIRMVS